jgi:hypothetical protein
MDNGDHGGDGHLTVSGSTFDGNTSYAHRGGNSNGGAIDNGDDGGDGTVTVSSSTFEANAAESGAFGSHGGAIDNADDGGRGALAVSASTFDINMVIGPGRDDGPLIENRDFGGTGTVTVAADIFNGTCGHGSGKGQWTDAGFNVGSSRTCQNGRTAHDITYWQGLSGFLGPLAANGGPTPTISLVGAGSRLGRGMRTIPDPTPALCPATDQRGYSSTSGKACDAGAYQTTGRAGAGT